MPATKWTSPGARRRQIVIQQEPTTGTGSKTALGFLSGTSGGSGWTTVITTWAKVTPKQMTSLGAVAKVIDDTPIVKMIYLVNIHYIPGVAILPGMRVVEQDPASNGATYIVQTVQDVDERHRELNLFCSQIPAPAAIAQ